MKRDEHSSGGRLWGGSTPREQTTQPGAQRADTPKAERTYVAHEIREHPRALHISCATQPSRFPAYRSLLDIIYDHNFDKVFTLVYSFMLVEVTGANLSALVHAISYGNCSRITEYHPKLFDKPAPGAAVIQSVKITAAISSTAARAERESR